MTRNIEHPALVRLRETYNRAIRHIARGPVPKHESDNVDEAIAAVIRQLGITTPLEWSRDDETGIVIAVGIVEVDDVLMNRHNMRRQFIAGGMDDQYQKLFAATQRAYIKLNTALYRSN